MSAIAPSGRIPQLRSALFEHSLKGLFLGLWLYLVVLHPNWAVVGRVVLTTAVGTLIGLALGAVQQFLRGFRPWKNLPGFLLITLLESSYVIYVGLLGGLGLGVVLGTDPPPERENWLYALTIGGVLLGVGTAQLRRLRSDTLRLILGFTLGAALLAGAIFAGLELKLFQPDSSEPDAVELMRLHGGLLLLGLPWFYLLIFCGETEESEAEAGVLFALLGLGLYLLRLASGIPEYGDKLIFLVPILTYVLYAVRLLPRLRVFKHTMRGYGFLSLGRVRDSLVSFGRALQLDKRNELATRGLYRLHRELDLNALEPETIRLLNFDFCTQLAEGVLLHGGTPTPAKLAESLRMLDLVESYSPAQRPRVDYLKAVAHTHAKDFDLAAGHLLRLLDAGESTPGAVRNSVLLPAWHLALKLHPEVVRRLGEPHLSLPGRRMEAIAAVERARTKAPEDAIAAELRPMLYGGLTHAEFDGAWPAAEFDYAYAEGLGLALLDENMPGAYGRAAMYLRVAAQGIPARGPWLYTRIAQAAQQHDDAPGVRRALAELKALGQHLGPKALATDQLALYRAGLAQLVDHAIQSGEHSAAVEDQRLLIESGQEDVNSLRKLAELHARSGDVLNALLITERGLLYSKTDPDLLAKKDSYYYSVGLERVTEAKDAIRGWFDLAYCTTKAKAVVEQKDLDLDTLDYGLHLVNLVRVFEPNRHSAMATLARLKLRQGDRDGAVQLLEDVREQAIGSGDEEEAWYLAVRMLAEIYMNELDRPDLAVGAYTAYTKSNKSGGETLFQLARAYEKLGNSAAAIKHYDAVSVYKDHPRGWEAGEAARRLKN